MFRASNKKKKGIVTITETFQICWCRVWFIKQALSAAELQCHLLFKQQMVLETCNRWKLSSFM